MAYTFKEFKEHHYQTLTNHRKEIEKLERKLRYANEQLSVLASILSDKADDAARLYPDFDYLLRKQLEEEK